MRFFGKKKNEELMDKSESLAPLVKILPGYKGYKNVKDREDSDVMFRERVVKDISKVINDFSRIMNFMIMKKLTDSWKISNQTNRKLQGILESAQLPDYRHSTFFTSKSLEGYIDVSVLYVIEYEIIDTIKSIGMLLSSIEESMELDDMKEVEQGVKKLYEVTVGMEKMFFDRIELIASYEIINV